MQISNSQLYAHTAGLQKLFSYKTKKAMDISRLASLSKGIYDNLEYRERVQKFVLGEYADMASNISSGILSLHVFDAYFLGEFIRTGKFPKSNTFNSILKFNEHASFYSPSEFIKQVDEICKEAEANNTALARFTRKAQSIVALRDDQTCILYDMLMSGKINIITYSYILNLKNVQLNFDKMKIDVFRVNKVAEYLGKFDLSQLLKK